jgi:hypothetical protein
MIVRTQHGTQFFVTPPFSCPIRRKQIVIADARQRIGGAGRQNHGLGVKSGDHAAITRRSRGDHAAFESPFWQIVEA